MATITPAALLTDANFALGLLGLGGVLDVVAIYDSTSFQQLFSDARPLKAVVRETSKIMEHPAENGIMISDHHIINQTEIDLSLFISAQFYAAMYQQIRTAYINATLLSVQTRTGIYPNMIIADMPHEESSEVYDAITIAMRLRQVFFSPSPVTYEPADPTNQNTIQNGLQSALTLGTTATAQAGALLSYANLFQRI